MQFFSALLLLMRFIIGTDRPRSALMALLAIAEGLLGPAVIAASGVVVSRAPGTLGAGMSSPAATRLMVAIGVLGTCFVLAYLLAPVRKAIATSIGSRVNQRMRELIFAATLTPAGIAHLEDSATADEIRRGGDFEWEQLAPTARIVHEMSTALATVVTGIGAALLLGRFAWWAPVVLVAACVATHLWMAGDEHRETAQRAEFAVAERRADYFRDLALDPPAAKETRLFGLAGYLAGQARGERLRFLTEVWQARRASRPAVVATISAIAAGSGAVFGALAYAAANGRVSAAELTVAVQAVFAISGLGHPLLATWWVRQGAAALPHLLGLPGRTDTARTRLGGTAPAAGLPRHAIRFSGVRFRYPGADRWVLDGVDLEIPAGTSLALVGANGEGKTTLLSLLARFHDPDGGAILVDGRDLRELEPRSWRRQLAVIFQDFVRYERSARENISLNLAGNDDAVSVEHAAERAGAQDFVADLPDGWETVLSRQYRGGADLSGGQWQRIALARALHAAERGARVLVLDEPAAALDVRAEAELFGRFLDITAGTTTILVTHRLSSVRHADRIAVLEGGRIVGAGTHEELLDAGGPYARMFGLQAARFHSGVGRD